MLVVSRPRIPRENQMKEEHREPPPCDEEIFKSGEGICSFHARTFIAEPWVARVREESGQRVDWHMSGGMCNVLFIGDYGRVRAAVEKLLPELVAACKANGYESGPELFRIYEPNSHGLYRKGDVINEDIIAVVTAPGVDAVAVVAERRVSTDQDGARVEGVVLSGTLSSTGLLKIKLKDGPTIVRHKNRVAALNDAARTFLGK